MENVTALNIQPQAGVLGVFSRLNYKPWYAIAEFVDNSTQSFYNNESILNSYGINTVTVHIKYDFESNILKITDDAFGMEMEDFARAVKVDSPPAIKDGRNEFGMGLKTAASWFGNIWSVESTQFGSTKKYSTEVDIQKLREKHLNTIDIVTQDCEPTEHGTTIVIRDVTKKIDGGRTKGKIIKLLESMYRRDLNSGKVKIWFNDVPLNFEEYCCLEYQGKKWRKNIDFCFEFDGQNHHVTGFVGILANGGFGRAGFALFRRGRVIIGGEDQNYKPEGIFGQAQSQISLKLFGEFNLEDFPVNQAKDGFVWDDGLESVFIDVLKKHIKEYIEIAKKSKKERAQEEEFSDEVSQNVEDEALLFAKLISSTNDDDNTIELSSLESESVLFDITDNDADTVAYDKFLHDTNEEKEKLVGGKRTYPIKLNNVVKKDFNVEWSIGSNAYWIKVEEVADSNEINIVININHPFFKPYSNNEDFKIVLEKLVLAFIVAEYLTKFLSDKEGYVPASAIRNQMNDFLSKISEN